MLTISLLYGLMALVGGIIGFVKVGSLASLIAGSVSGILIIISTLAYMRGRIAGYYALLTITVLVGGWFLKGYLATGKIMPAAVMTLLSALNLLVLLVFKKPSQHQPLH